MSKTVVLKKIQDTFCFVWRFELKHLYWAYKQNGLVVTINRVPVKTKKDSSSPLFDQIY